MGPGTRMLLENIRDYASIREAAKAMDMSYTKALRMLRTMEEELGFPVVISERGGIQRGGTRLTEKGEQVLDVFEEIEEEVYRYASKLVKEKFVF